MESNRIQKQDPQLNAPVEAVELSEREREILVLVAGGASNKEVALKLVISPNTVKVHLRNIFGKIGVSSRTEAALYAVRAGLVRVAVEQPATDAEAINGTVPERLAAVIPLAPVAPALPAAPVAARRRRLWAVALAAALILLVVSVAVAPLVRPGAAPTPTSLAISSEPRWQNRAALPTARSRLAAATYENQIYAIAGETAAGVTGLTQRYDPLADTWSALADKPVAVADVGAAVLGGLIYVPGGRLASGEVTATVEVYDPGADTWDARASLPVALSGYALASFEGRLYLFGGWNGADFVASVYEYDPAADEWLERTRMPTARGFAAASASGGKIYVIGGTDGKGPQHATEAYVPSRDSQVANPWETLTPAPASHSVLGAATIADTLYVVGREDQAGGFSAWEFRPERNQWQPLELAAGFAPEWMSVVALQTHIYVLGGLQADGQGGQLVAYQALYTNLIPVVTGGEGEQ